MERTIQVKTWGNSAGVLLPKEWIGKEVRVILIDRTLEIKKEIFDILSPYLEDIVGIYLVGSYARGEQTEDSDIDIIAISNNTKKEIISGKYNVIITTLKSVETSLEKNSILIAPKIMEAKTILNFSLLEKLKSKEITKKSLKFFIESTESIITINKKTLELDKIEGETASLSVVYSLVLRLRGILMIKCIVEKKPYSNQKFKEWIEKETELDYEKIYYAYDSIKQNKKIDIKIELSDALKLLHLLEKEIEKIDNLKDDK
jgi:predicted nucleotidyltransferase